MRAVGIHIILATQSPKVQVVSTIVKTNLPVKMAFSVPTNTASILIIDKGDAKDLEPKGRYIYQGRGDFIEVQAPFLSDRQIRQIIQDAIDGKTRSATARGHDITDSELVRYAVHHLGGKLTGDDLFNHFQGRISFQELAGWLKSMDGDVIEVDGKYYEVKPPRGSIGRSVELKNNGNMAPLDEKERRTKSEEQF
jgi:DNA segregation ATPase FtsK/SpoIIIE-like protein